jgi:uncharacterized beta-barrel protein YwiB (DUF1934 family)
MSKNVWLSIVSIQRINGGEEERVTLMTAGRLYRRNGKFYISYEESELTGLEDTRTTIKLEPGQVTMIRTGAYPSQMIFAEHIRHVGLYHTFLGAMTISIYTSHIENTVDEDGGLLVIDYVSDMENRIEGQYHFELFVEVAREEDAPVDASQEEDEF